MGLIAYKNNYKPHAMWIKIPWENDKLILVLINRDGNFRSDRKFDLNLTKKNLNTWPNRIWPDLSIFLKIELFYILYNFLMYFEHNLKLNWNQTQTRLDYWDCHPYYSNLVFMVFMRLGPKMGSVKGIEWVVHCVLVVSSLLKSSLLIDPFRRFRTPEKSHGNTRFLWVFRDSLNIL